MKYLKREEGFTLIEVVVALGILSTAAIGFSTLSRGSIDSAKQIEMRYLARTVVDNELTRVFTNQASLPIGVTNGDVVQMGRSFEWVRTVERSPQEGLLRVQLQVRETDSETVLAQTRTFKRLGQ